MKRYVAQSATLMLVVVTLLWGLTFPLMKEWQNGAEAEWTDLVPEKEDREVLASFALLGLRMLLSMLLLAAVRPVLWREATAREHGWGLVVGVLFTIGCGFQFVGLARTTPAMSAFITSLASAWVPVVAFLVLRITVRAVTLTGLLIGFAGVIILAGLADRDRWAVRGGEMLTFLSTIPFAFQILLVDRLGKRLNPAHLTLGMLFVGGAAGILLTALVAYHGPGFAGCLELAARLLANPKTLAAFAGLIVLATLTFHWMNVYQPRVPASRAALVYLLEPVFASVFSIAMGFEKLTDQLLLGGGLIIAGNVLAELPGWLRERRDQGNKHGTT